MLVFGHAGITLGAAALFAKALRSSRFSETTESETIGSSPRFSQVTQAPNDFPDHKASWLTYLGSLIDMRLLLVGSLLPDIIDKPVGQFFFRETFSNGRIFCHTLLFLILLTVAGFYFYRRHVKTWLLTFSFGTLTHLIFDQMWYAPRTLLWPLFGLAFEREDVSNWIQNTLYALLSDPVVYVPELVGVMILIWFLWTLLHTKNTYVFIRYGRIQ